MIELLMLWLKSYLAIDTKPYMVLVKVRVLDRVQLATVPRNVQIPINYESN